MAGDLGVADRLRTARRLAGYETAQDAVDEFELEYGTYIHHENGTRSVSLETAARYAEMFDVNLTWLATGRGPQTGSRVPSPTLPSIDDLSAEAKEQVLNLIKLLKR